MEKRIRAVACDLDGSLLTDTKDISSRDLETIRRLKAHGIQFFICTGRHYDFSRRYAALAQLETPIISSNGTCLYDLREKRLIYSACFDPETIARLIRYFEGLHLREYYIYTKYTVYYGPTGAPLPYWLEKREDFAPEEQPGAVPIDINFSPYRDDVLKFMLRHIGDDGIAAAQKALGDHADGAHFYHADGSYTEIVPGGRDKGAGIRTACSLYGFAPEETLAIGDQLNDLEMLETVGYPVVPENGCDAAKARARYVCRANNDSPLTDAIAHFCPEYLK